MKPREFLVASVLALSLGACASSSRPPARAADLPESHESSADGGALKLDPEDPQSALLEAVEAFDTRMMSISPEDCADAEALLRTICGLAKRICRLAEDTPTDIAAKNRCTDATFRCERATQRYDKECS